MREGVRECVVSGIAGEPDQAGLPAAAAGRASRPPLQEASGRTASAGGGHSVGNLNGRMLRTVS